MKVFLKILALAAGVLFASLVVTLTWTSYQGRRELTEIQRDLLARGEKLTLVELTPAPIPDAQNFFADSVWQPADHPCAALEDAPTPTEVRELKRRFPAFAGLDFSRSRAGLVNEAWQVAPDQAGAAFILAVLQPLNPTLERISPLIERLDARLPISYEKALAPPIPLLPPLMNLHGIYQARARAELALGQNADACQDVLRTLRLDETLTGAPLLMTQILRNGLTRMSLQALAAGLSAHAWSDPELQLLQRALQERDLREGLALAYRGELGGGNQFFRQLARGEVSIQNFSASGRDPFDRSSKESARTGLLARAIAAGYLAVFGSGDQALYNQQLGKLITAADRAAAKGLRPEFFPDFGRLPELISIPSRMKHMYSTVSLPALPGVARRVAETQNRVIQAGTACALERFFLRDHEYPTTLDQLIPDFLPAYPIDVVTLQPQRYRRIKPGAYRLWSDGWDLKNDDSKPADLYGNDGDWVWNELPSRKSQKRP